MLLVSSVLTQAQQQDSNKICLDTADFIRIANEMRVLKAQKEFLIERLATVEVENEIKDEMLYYCEEEKRKDKIRWGVSGVIVGIFIKIIIDSAKK